jgi:hypothetical protein
MRQLRDETLARATWIFSALAGAVGVIRRILLRITRTAPGLVPRFPAIDRQVPGDDGRI